MNWTITVPAWNEQQGYGANGTPSLTIEQRAVALASCLQAGSREDAASHCRELAKNLDADTIPRTTVAAALAELLKCFSNARDLHSAAANDKDYQGEEETSARLSAAAVSWQDAINYLGTTIAKLGLTAEAFDAAIASRPDALEKLTDKALEETK